MKRTNYLGLALALVAGLTVAAESPRARDEARVAATSRVFEGERSLDKADVATSNARRLSALDDAVRHFKVARSSALKRPADYAFAEILLSADRGLVEAYDDQAGIYLSRGSVWNAKQSVKSALAIRPDDVRTLDLACVVAAEEGNHFDRYDGSIAAQRVVARRVLTGTTVR